MNLILQDARTPDRDGRAEIGIEGGRIAVIAPRIHEAADSVLDLGGRLVLPGFVEPHIHLDKAFLSERAPSVEGTLAEAIRITGAAKRSFTAEDIAARARRVLDLAIRHGTTLMRNHVEVDPVVGLMGLEAILVLKAEYEPAIDLQLCIFPQEGILQAPGTEALMREAMRRGGQVVGGIPYNDTDPKAHIDLVFAIAMEFDAPVDFHIDFFDEPEHLHVRHVIDRTRAEGYGGRVALGHLTELGAMEGPELDDLLAELAEAGIGVITLPATDLYLMGRKDRKNVRRGLAPVKQLRAAGIPVAYASNNIRNAFTPFGNADPLQIGLLLANTAHFGTAEENRQLLPMATTEAARVIGAERDYGLRPGAWADLVVLDCERPEDAIVAQPEKRYVFKRGRLVAESIRETRYPWRESHTHSPWPTS